MSSVLRFRGRIAGWGTASGTRVVVGRWDASPFGVFADVMVERPDGERILLAPAPPVADLVAATYRFDRVEVCPVSVTDLDPEAVIDRPKFSFVRPGLYLGRPGFYPGRPGVPLAEGVAWRVVAGPLEARLGVGPRTVLGHVLRAVPRRVTTSRHLTLLTDPVARVLLRGVRTRGSAGLGRTERYGATDVHALVTADTRWDGEPLGDLRDVDPPVRFGFGSTPRRPSVTDVVTTIVAR
ncbi:hypothetical protein JN535_10265 [Cellulosimicrobium cellulans]|uniref:hypothetical protein n=1 Tax=Cellulosimicrobium cellulans TaxID=1710 RepID=UPI0019652762|nr:hypothetical protein [Cellulosimicrobium cellulans]MBN0040546.1 hypothetical protein [Cellulosimicrobium cellulans]